MTTLMPIDANNNPIPALKLSPNGAQQIAATSSTSNTNASAFSSQTRVISVYADAPIYVSFGESDVTASTSDHYFPAGVYYDFAIGGDNSDHTPYIAVRAVTDATTVYVSEKQ